MTKEVVILVADDDPGHVRLVQKNLGRAGLRNPVKHFEDGQQVLDFFFDRNGGQSRHPEASYLLLLDIRMPKVDGVEVLRQLKEDAALRKIPVIMLTTTDDPREVRRCHELGCNNYIVKPVDYEKFADVVKNLGLFISLVEVPEIEKAG